MMYPCLRSDKSSWTKALSGWLLSSHSRMNVHGGVHGTQVSGDDSCTPHKWDGAITSGVWPSTSLTGMEKYVDRSWAGPSVVIVLTWLWLIMLEVFVRGGRCVREE